MTPADELREAVDKVKAMAVIAGTATGRNHRAYAFSTGDAAALSLVLKALEAKEEELTKLREENAELREELTGFVSAAVAEVNEKGSGGYLLARIADARKLLRKQGGAQC